MFETALAPPPHLFLVSPWSPPLPPSDPLYYRQPLDWIPDALITTQEYTLPLIATTLRGVEETLPVVKEVLSETSAAVNDAIGSAVDSLRSWWGGKSPVPAMSRTASGSTAESPSAPSGGGDAATRGDQLGTIPASMTGLPAVPDADVPDEPERQRLWAPSAKNLAMDYMQAENTKGVAQGELPLTSRPVCADEQNTCCA